MNRRDGANGLGSFCRICSNWTAAPIALAVIVHGGKARSEVDRGRERGDWRRRKDAVTLIGNVGRPSIVTKVLAAFSRAWLCLLAAPALRRRRPISLCHDIPHDRLFAATGSPHPPVAAARAGSTPAAAS